MDSRLPFPFLEVGCTGLAFVCMCSFRPACRCLSSFGFIKPVSQTLDPNEEYVSERVRASESVRERQRASESVRGRQRASEGVRGRQRASGR